MHNNHTPIKQLGELYQESGRMGPDTGCKLDGLLNLKKATKILYSRRMVGVHWLTIQDATISVTEY